jgi:hypothetical protein
MTTYSSLSIGLPYFRKLVWIALVLIFLSKILFGASLPTYIMTFGMILLALKMLDVFSAGVYRVYKNRRSQMRPLDRLALLFPERLVLLVRLESEMYRAFWASWSGKIKTKCEAQFSISGGPKFNMLPIVVLFSVIVEIPFSVLIVSLVIDDPARKMAWHLFLILTSLYALVWIKADRFSIFNSGHSIESGNLVLRCGFRANATIAFLSIESAEVISADEWRALAQNARDVNLVTVVVSPMDKPNVALRINRSGAFSGFKNGASLKRPDLLGVYVDKPNDLVKFLQRIMSTHQKA